MSDVIKNIKNSDFLQGLFGVLFLILPGTMTLFVFYRELFITLDWIKLILLSMAIILPIATFNITIFLVMNYLSSKNEDFYDFIVGIITTGASIYAGLLFNYFKPIALGQMILWIGLVDFIMGILALFSVMKHNKT